MAVSTLTQRQSGILNYIKWFQEMHGFGPSYQEIMEKFHLHSKSGVHRVIQALCDRGLMRKTPNLARQYEILEGKNCPHCGGEL